MTCGPKTSGRASTRAALISQCSREGLSSDGGSLPPASPPNNGMHPTRDTSDFIYHQGAGGRVMPGVGPTGDSFKGRSMKSEKEKMLGGELYDPLDPELSAERRRARLL